LELASLSWASKSDDDDEDDDDEDEEEEEEDFEGDGTTWSTSISASSSTWSTLISASSSSRLSGLAESHISQDFISSLLAKVHAKQSHGMTKRLLGSVAAGWREKEELGEHEEDLPPLHRLHHQSHSVGILDHAALRLYPQQRPSTRTNRVRATVVDVVDVVVKYRSMGVCFPLNCVSRLDVHVRVVV
jgi:hypothetical protein